MKKKRARLVAESLPRLCSGEEWIKQRLAFDSVIIFGGVVIEMGIWKTPSGGRWGYFLCPLCKRKCRYVFNSEGEIGCRRCLRVVPAYQNLSNGDRLFAKVLKRRRALGQQRGGLIAPFPQRQKRHWSAKYERAKALALVDEQKLLRLLAKRVRLRNRR